MKSTLAISVVTFVELARQKIVLLLIFLGFFLLGLSVLFTKLTFDERLRILVHVGFGAIQIVLLLLALFVGGYSLHRELEKQTLFMVLARPLSRSKIFWGKFLGIFLVILFFHVVLFGIHYHLVGSVIKYPLRFVWAHLFLLIEIFCIAGVTFGVSAILKPPLAIGIGVSVWIVGYWLDDLIFFAKRAQMVFYELVAFFAKYLFPRLSIGSELRGIYFLHEGTIVYWGGLHALQIVLFPLILLIIGEWVFLKKDLS
ncbi:MAG: ABC transporter permease [Bdellovibrionaceae bacterium]|nr:ABC transporter permease [Pseudobdellovibrionaceae bacterium]MDW8190939.1 ABC transporter permease subunit [Pseudobdellovibrionaceae bacterium]